MPATSRVKATFLVYSVKTVTGIDKYSSDETRDENTTLYSTLKSANRAALEWAKENMTVDDRAEFEEQGSYNYDGGYVAAYWPSKYEKISVEVTAVEVLGPDLAKGEVDSESEPEDGESENSTDDGSSEVEIVEVSRPAKRFRSG